MSNNLISLPYILHFHPFTLQHICEILGCELHRGLRQLRDVVTLHPLAMEVGIFNGELEGLGESTLAVEMGDVGTGEHTIVAA